MPVIRCRARDLAARIYDKTAEVRRRGVSWLPDLWGTEGSDPPVWKLEFKYRRAVLAEFILSSVDEVVASVQDLWRYGTEEWVSLRVPTNHSVRRRWPVDPVWEEIRGHPDRSDHDRCCASAAGRGQ